MKSKKNNDNDNEINPSVRKREKDKTLEELQMEELRAKILTVERERSYWERKSNKMEEKRNKWRLTLILILVLFGIIIAIKVLSG